MKVSNKLIATITTITTTTTSTSLISLLSLVNAFDFGNVIRFINHSIIPNADFRKVFFEGLVHVVCSTIKEIKKGEQITVNYGASYWIARKNDIKVDII
jgi:hypothetical protein